MLETIKEPTLTDEQRAAVDILVRLDAGVQTLGGYAGCLSGDTILQYVRGSRINSRPITMLDMYLKFNRYKGTGRGAAQRWDTLKPTFLYSVWPDGTVGRNRVVSVLKSGVKPTIRLDFSNDRHLILTDDHPIATPSGEYIKSSRLRVGDMVLAIGDMKTKSVGRRPRAARPDRVLVNLKYHPMGGCKVVVCNGVEYRYCRVHRARLVVEAAMNNLSYERFVYYLKMDAEASAKLSFIPAEYDVHHLDEDPLNDSIDNLEVILHSEHPKLHNPGGHFNREYSLEVQVTRISECDERATYDIQMESPANNFAANGIFVHNTGKTTVIKSLVKRLPRFAVCAYTGKATQVLRRKRIPASTIHSLIYRPVTDGGGLSFELRGRDEFGADGVIVDEASMVSSDIFDDLKSLGVPLIFVGDHGQLEPVGGGGFNLMAKPNITLEQIHRNAGEIARFAEHLRRGGEARDWPSGGKVRLVESGDEDAFSALEGDFQVICAYNKTRVDLNHACREDRGMPRGKPVVGDRVICLQNDRESGVFNGMQGLVGEIDGRVLRFDAGDLRVRLAYAPAAFGAEKALPRQLGIVPFDWAYCVTCHKAQGDEWSHVVVLEQRCRHWSHSSWAYTAASRAKDKLTWILDRH